MVGDEALTQMLIGLEVTYPSINHFHFDWNGRIEWYVVEADFVGALTDALKSPELVVRVLGHALIEKDHMIGDESDGRQLAIVEEVEGENNMTEVRAASIPALSDDSLDMMPPHSSWSCINSDKLDSVAVVSDDELAPDSSSDNRPNRLGLSYILATE